MAKEKMKIELWSDIACPYCYIGKRQYEMALARFPHADEVELVWKSYLLEPDISIRETGESLFQHLGMATGKEQKRYAKITTLAASVGLAYHIELVVKANTLKAHQLSHLAKSKGSDVQNRMEEALFSAYFVEGLDLNDPQVLITLAVKAGLPSAEVTRAFNEQTYVEAISEEMHAAEEMDLDYIPYFRFNKSHVISGIQSVERYLAVLEKAYEEWKNNEIPGSFNRFEGKSCSIDGHCE